MDGSLGFKKGLYLNLGIIAGAVVVFTGFFILIKLNIQNQTSVINDIRSKETSITESAENLSVLVKEWSVAKNYSQQVALLVPSKDDLVSLQKDINNIARQDGVSLGFNFGTESGQVASGGIGSIAFSATMDGSKDGLVAFLKDIESKYYSLKMNVLELSGLSGTLLRLTTSGQIFYDSSN